MNINSLLYTILITAFIYVVITLPHILFIISYPLWVLILLGVMSAIISNIIVIKFKL